MCYLVTDPPGDGSSRAAGVIASDALDILSADVATGKKNVTYVLRMKTTKLSGDTWARLGYKWDVQFTLQGINYAVQRAASMDPTGALTYSDMFYAGQATTDIPASSVKMDGTTYTWTVPRSWIPGLKKANQKLIQIQAGSQVFGSNADVANTTKTYPDQWPSCVKVT